MEGVSILMEICMKHDWNTEMLTPWFSIASGKPQGFHSKRPLPVRTRWLKLPALNLNIWILFVVTLALTAISSANETTTHDKPKENPAVANKDRQINPLLPDPPGTVLFVGNSFTFWNEGLWTHMQDLTAARGDGLGVKTSRIVRGGASLRVLYKRTMARQEIAKGDYDIVVLQEDLPETKITDFHKYAGFFDEHTREAGSRLIFFMTWDYQRLNWISMDEIITEHKRMARELDAEVAPCGYAWQRAMKERPKVDLYSRDREHQSWHGTILNLYVIYSTIYRESPEVLKFTPPRKSGITADEDAWLRRVAWESVQAWQEQMKKAKS